jgi:N-acetylmuramoyl-L-alanine amidase
MKLDRNSHDYKILLKTIYGEARHESRRVQLGVAWVILNRARLNKSYFGGCSIADVCQSRGQFECWKMGSFHMYDRDAKRSIEEWLPFVYQYADPTNGCDYFHNPFKQGYPEWTKDCTYIITIGSLKFYKTKPRYR